VTVTVTDLFCGAGGSSLGAETVVGVELVMAANHWQTAIDVHQVHFPNARHDTANISQADPRRYPLTQILLASPECFPAETLITTRQGQVPIEDIRIGDIALTHLGRWRKVVRIQVRLAGNAVTPPAMAWIVGRLTQALEAAQ
jgi:site-specific DNA-cytosine methylase